MLSDIPKKCTLAKIHGPENFILLTLRKAYARLGVQLPWHRTYKTDPHGQT